VGEILCNISVFLPAESSTSGSGLGSVASHAVARELETLEQACEAREQAVSSLMQGVQEIQYSNILDR